VNLGQLQKELLRRLVPHARRPHLRALYNRATWRLYRGDNVTCNCCGGHFRRFRISNTRGDHRTLMCPRCGSLGRHRVDWLYLTGQTDVLQRPTRLLHIAPELCLSLPLRGLPNVSYLSGDYDMTLAMEQIDVRKIGYADESFDGVICNHVLNVVDDDRSAMSELGRVIKTGGWALLQSAVDPSLEHTEEHSRTVTPESEDGRYEEVMIRRYGRDYVARLEEAGLTVTVSSFVADLPRATVKKFGLDPEETIFFCRKLGPLAEDAGSEVRPRETIPDQAVARHYEAE
jgi:SAM-dependent methyltransferase